MYYFNYTKSISFVPVTLKYLLISVGYDCHISIGYGCLGLIYSSFNEKKNNLVFEKCKITTFDN